MIVNMNMSMYNFVIISLRGVITTVSKYHVTYLIKIPAPTSVGTNMNK